MKAVTVLNMKPDDNPQEIRDKWLKEYNLFADKFANVEERAAMLSKRVKRAYALIVDNRDSNTNMPELDGDFPLGNEADASFAGTYFSIADLAGIQLGYHNLVNCGYYTEYNYAVLVRMGFIAEMNGDWIEAARCYEGVPISETVQNREYACRRKAKALGNGGE